MFVYILLLVIIGLCLYFFPRQKEHFDSELVVRNLPVDENTQIRKKILFPDDKNPFLDENELLLWNDSIEFRNDITTSQNTYTPNYLEKMLKPFADITKYTENDTFTELPKDEKVDIDFFLKITDNITNMFLNAIYYDLFKNPNRPTNIVCPNINMCRIELINKKIVRVRKNKKGIFRWDILIQLALFNKAYSYGILCIVENEILINIKVIGITTQDKYRLKTNYNRDPSLMITQDTRGQYELNSNYYYRYNENDKVLLPGDTNKMVDNYIKRQLLTTTGALNFKKVFPKDYKCFGSNGNDQTVCENNYDTYYRSKPRGIWDKYCKVDSDCPFFKANKNYTNTFGGCNDGICNMPLGLNQLSPRYYDIDTEPMCYNCPNKKNDCCKTQKNPDYIFEDDLLVRKAYETELAEKGLKLT